MVIRCPGRHQPQGRGVGERIVNLDHPSGYLNVDEGLLTEWLVQGGCQRTTPPPTTTAAARNMQMTINHVDYYIAT